MQSGMRNGGARPTARRTARRATAVAVLGWLVALCASVLVAPAAVAAPTADVVVRDLTPPLVSIDPGGTVTFTNGIQDKTVQVGGGGLLPSVVTVLVHTDVTLTLPSGTHPLQPGQQVQERFADSCLVGCAITYTYRTSVPDTSIVGGVLNTVTGKALAGLPQTQLVSYNGGQTTVRIGVPTPFLVNTILPDLPNLPSVNLPQLPPVTLPTLPTLPTPDLTPLPELPTGGGTTTPVAPSATAPLPAGGQAYSYGTPSGTAQLAPGGDAGSALDATRLPLPGSDAAGAQTGGGGVAGSNDGAVAPGYGQLAGLGRPTGSDDGVDVAADGEDLPSAQLGVPALLAVIALAGSSAALLWSRRNQRASR